MVKNVKVVHPNQPLKSAISHSSRFLISSDEVEMVDIPVHICVPGEKVEPKLKVRKENGKIKGFDYRCACGHTDHFLCE